MISLDQAPATLLMATVIGERYSIGITVEVVVVDDVFIVDNNFKCVYHTTKVGGYIPGNYSR